MLRNELALPLFDVPTSFSCGLEGIVHGVNSGIKRRNNEQLTFDLDKRNEMFYYGQKEDPKIGGQML